MYRTMNPKKPTDKSDNHGLNDNTRAIFRLVDRAGPAFDSLPNRSLSSGDRMRCAGHLFDDDDKFVGLVARALREYRKLFPDVPYDPDRMVEGMHSSTGYLALHEALSDLAQRAWDNYLLERSASKRGTWNSIAPGGLSRLPAPA